MATQTAKPTLEGTYQISPAVDAEGEIEVSFSSTSYTVCHYGPDGELLKTALVTMERMESMYGKFDVHQAMGTPGARSFADWLHLNVGWTLAAV